MSHKEIDELMADFKTMFPLEQDKLVEKQDFFSRFKNFMSDIEKKLKTKTVKKVIKIITALFLSLFFYFIYKRENLLFNEGVYSSIIMTTLFVSMILTCLYNITALKIIIRLYNILISPDNNSLLHKYRKIITFTVFLLIYFFILPQPLNNMMKYLQYQENYMTNIFHNSTVDFKNKDLINNYAKNIHRQGGIAIPHYLDNIQNEHRFSYLILKKNLNPEEQAELKFLKSFESRKINYHKMIEDAFKTGTLEHQILFSKKIDIENLKKQNKSFINAYIEDYSEKK